jgi:hypothetical protein
VDPLQLHPSKTPDDFDSLDDYFVHLDALRRFTNFLPPRRRMPDPDKHSGGVPIADPPRNSRHGRWVKSRHVGIRLTQRDFELLDELARAHAVPPGTMARMLIVRAVRAAADASD